MPLRHCASCTETTSARFSPGAHRKCIRIESGAIADKQGKFEAANRGTIFLDEVGKLPLHLLQVKILRVLQEREVDKVGETRPIKVDVRVIAATNRSLERMTADASFREDLCYRLAVVSIRVPPLRERSDDIPLLVDHFLAKHVEWLGRPRPAVDKAVYSAFNLYAWRGRATSASWRT
jgi:Nif-specific regulatory protein